MYAITDCAFQNDYKYIAVTTQLKHIFVVDAFSGEMKAAWEYNYPSGVTYQLSEVVMMYQDIAYTFYSEQRRVFKMTKFDIN